jgi:hypothetical protein
MHSALPYDSSTKAIDMSAVVSCRSGAARRDLVFGWQERKATSTIADQTGSSGPCPSTESANVRM